MTSPPRQLSTSGTGSRTVVRRPRRAPTVRRTAGFRHTPEACRTPYSLLPIGVGEGHREQRLLKTHDPIDRCNIPDRYCDHVPGTHARSQTRTDAWETDRRGIHRRGIQFSAARQRSTLHHPNRTQHDTQIQQSRTPLLFSPLSSKLRRRMNTAWSVPTARRFPRRARCLGAPSSSVPTSSIRSTSRACSNPPEPCRGPDALLLADSALGRGTAQRLTLFETSRGEAKQRDSSKAGASIP